MELFPGIGTINAYDERKVGRYEQGDLLVSTILVTDSDNPYETAVSHPKYNDGKIVIVEEYASVEEAEVGHKKWVKIMTTDPLPEKLEDVSSCFVKKLMNLFSGE